MKPKPSPRIKDDSEYRAAFDRWQELKAEFTAVDRDIQGHNMSDVPKVDRLRAQAVALLEGEDPKVVDEEERNRTLGKLYERQRILREALRLQEQKVQTIESAVSKRIAKEVRPEYEAIMRKAVTALLALAEVADEEDAFRDRLREGGVKFASYIQPVALTNYRLTGVEQTRTSYLLDEIERLYGIKTKRPR